MSAARNTPTRPDEGWEQIARWELAHIDRLLDWADSNEDIWSNYVGGRLMVKSLRDRRLTVVGMLVTALGGFPLETT